LRNDLIGWGYGLAVGAMQLQRDAFDCPVVLLNSIFQVFRLAQFNTKAGIAGFSFVLNWPRRSDL
jgi:hypothetical protein